MLVSLSKILINTADIPLLISSLVASICKKTNVVATSSGSNEAKMLSTRDELSLIKTDGTGGFDLYQTYLTLTSVFEERNVKNVYLPTPWEVSDNQIPIIDELRTKYEYMAFGFPADNSHQIAVWAR